MLYAAYGSNTNLDQMARRCPNSKRVCNGIIENYKLVFNVHLDIIPCKNENVYVVLWEIDSKDWKSLDMYEGYPQYYIRKKVDVVRENGKREKAIVYVMTDDCKGISPPARNYFYNCEIGFIENGLPTESLYNALEYSVYNETYYNQYNSRNGNSGCYTA